MLILILSLVYFKQEDAYSDALNCFFKTGHKILEILDSAKDKILWQALFQTTV